MGWLDDGYPNLGGTAKAYGIAPVRMDVSARLLPGQSMVGAGANTMWIMPGSGQRPAGLGCFACMAKDVPGGMSDFVSRGMGDGSNTNSANASASSSSVSSSHATGGNAQNTITIQPGSGSGIMSGESAPFVLALGGLAIFGGIFYFAMKGR